MFVTRAAAFQSLLYLLSAAREQADGNSTAPLASHHLQNRQSIALGHIWVFGHHPKAKNEQRELGELHPSSPSLGR